MAELLSGFPAPWRVELQERLVAVYDASGFLLLALGWTEPGGRERAIALAHLVAAAPALHEVCSEAYDLLSGAPAPLDSPDAWRDQVRRDLQTVLAGTRPRPVACPQCHGSKFVRNPHWDEFWQDVRAHYPEDADLTAAPYAGRIEAAKRHFAACYGPEVCACPACSPAPVAKAPAVTHRRGRRAA